jgi:catechol-2,3-dioxygenase
MDDNIPASSSSPTEANSKASNHVAVSVPDLDKAVKWYHEVLGFNIVTETYGRQR